jgi:endo-1,4-beta-D-glucanase Y
MNSSAERTVEDALSESWAAYKQKYLRSDGYVFDPRRGYVTSEGQGYALLRAALMRDREAFERVLAWTQEHLRRPDGLYAWLWSPEEGGAIVDENTATDADQEIALALILAAEAFDREEYRSQAQSILRAIRAEEAVSTPNGWFPAAGNWAVEERIVNLSYFLPYAYPYFARVDPEGDWMQVRETGYDLLRRTLGRPETRLIPDFMALEPDGTVAALPDSSSLGRNFSFDAMRIFWRVAMDCKLHQNRRACADPARSGVVADLLARDGALFSTYTTSGRVLDETPSVSFYGSVLPALRLHRPRLAESLRRATINASTLAALAEKPKRYYDMNWVWFGLAADAGMIARRVPAPEDLDPGSQRASAGAP